MYQDWTALPFVLHAMSTIEEYVNTFELEDLEKLEESEELEELKENC
jgi:hypothetical protein